MIRRSLALLLCCLTLQFPRPPRHPHFPHHPHHNRYNGITVALLILSLLLTTGCATIHRHPKLVGITIGVAAGATIAIIQNRHYNCPSTIDGIPYNGTAPCPKSCDHDGCYWPTTRR